MSPRRRSPALVRDADYWRFIYHLLVMRSGHRCEVCGRPIDASTPASLHHRQPRGMGGTNNPDVDSLTRLVIAHGDGVRGCHGWVESYRNAAEARGLLVRQGHDPEHVALVLASGRRVMLHPTAPFYLPVTDGVPYDLRPLHSGM